MALPPLRVKPAVTVIEPVKVIALVTTELFDQLAVKAAKVVVFSVSAMVKIFPPVIVTLTVPHDFPPKSAVVSAVAVIFIVCVVLVMVGAVPVNETLETFKMEELRVRVLAKATPPSVNEPQVTV